MNENSFTTLLKKLKVASDECWAAKLALHDLGNKYAPLCIQILVEGRHIPNLINNRINQRKFETGLDAIHPDFWDADMLIALTEHFDTMEGPNASS